MIRALTRWYWSTHEYLYLIFKGRFVVACSDYKELEGIEMDGKKIPFIEITKTSYVNASRSWPHTLTFTEAPRGASVFSFFAAIIVRKALKKKMPSKDISLITVQDHAFIDHVYNGNEK